MLQLPTVSCSTCFKYLSQAYLKRPAARLRRLVVQLERTHGYFFWLYVAYCSCEGVLAVLALLYFPPKAGLLLWSPHEEGYLVCPLPLRALKAQSRRRA